MADTGRLHGGEWGQAGECLETEQQSVGSAAEVVRTAIQWARVEAELVEEQAKARQSCQQNDWQATSDQNQSLPIQSHTAPYQMSRALLNRWPLQPYIRVCHYTRYWAAMVKHIFDQVKCQLSFLTNEFSQTKWPKNWFKWEQELNVTIILFHVKNYLQAKCNSTKSWSHREQKLLNE